MLRNKLKDIAKDSSVYGISKVIGQAISFFLIPLYTSYLSPDDYGVLSIIGLFASSLTLIMNFGLDSATYYFAGLASNEEKEKSSIANAQFLTIVLILALSVFLLLNLNNINHWILEQSQPIAYLIIGIGIGIFSSMSSIPRAYLRIKRKVKVIAISTLINVVFSILTTLMLVVGLKMGVIGALLGNLAGSLFSSVYIMLKVPVMGFRQLNWNSSKELLAYSLPTLPAQIFAFAIPLYSQWSVKQLLSLNELGLYAVGLKFTIPLTVVLTMFQQAYAPYKYHILKTDQNPKDTFVKIMNLFVIGFGVAVIVVTLFGGDVLKLMTNSNYHQAANYVFYLALIPFVQGMYFMFSTGVEFSKFPAFRPIISGLGLITVLFINHYLIKNYGVPGAAISIVCSWGVMAIGNLVYAQHLYKIHYSWPLIIGVFLVVVGVGYGINTIWEINLLYRIVIGICIVIATLGVLKRQFNLKLLLRK